MKEWFYKMEWFYKTIEFLSSIAPLVAASIFGSLIALTKEGKKRTLTMSERVLRVFSGVLTSYYITPVVINSLNLDDKMQSPVGFLIGYIGIEILDIIVIFGKSKFNIQDTKTNTETNDSQKPN